MNIHICDSEESLGPECEEGLNVNLDCDINKKVLCNKMDKFMLLNILNLVICSFRLVFKIQVHLLSFLSLLKDYK